MNRTRQKLEEAEFFLEQLDQHYYDDLQHLLASKHFKPVFQHFLNAFVASARSVTWVMQSEYGSRARWREWYEQQNAPADMAELLEVFRDLRNRAVKAEPLSPGRAIGFLDQMPANRQRDPRLPKFKISIAPVNEDGSTGQLLVEGEIGSYCWTLDEFEGEDLLPACRRYFQFLRDLVERCESQFPPITG